jgi:carbon-monoxide dehydrogenase small subunit
MSNIHVRTKINGDVVDYVCEADETLLDVLRNRLGLTGAKEGCGTGDCGACSVTIDGRLTCSCLVLGAEADGSEIGTIEGMAEGEKLHPLRYLHARHLGCGQGAVGKEPEAHGNRSALWTGRQSLPLHRL